MPTPLAFAGLAFLLVVNRAEVTMEGIAAKSVHELSARTGDDRRMSRLRITREFPKRVIHDLAHVPMSEGERG